MYFIYSLLLGLAILVLLPRFLFDAFHHGKYVAGFRERFGFLTPLPPDGRPVIWIHCVSVGEAQAARPLVKGLRDRFPNHRLVVSTITKTGQNLAREIFRQDVDRVFYFPFDWRWIVRRTLESINPTVVLIMETELWPGFLRECSLRRIPVAIVNGRLSAQSFRRYRLIKGFMARVLSSISMAIMQTEADAERLRHLGMDARKTKVSGNLKFDAGTMAVNNSLTAEFRERFSLDNTSLILAASTHSPEERIILDALKQISSTSSSGVRLMIAPRHPERFTEVAGLIESAGLRWIRSSARRTSDDSEAQVILLDSIGELQSMYPLAAIVFVGGSISRSGGHNILEPAAVGACIITGPYTHNFHQIVQTFAKADAVIQLPRIPESKAQVALANTISALLANRERRDELGKRAQTLLRNNRGATQVVLNLLETIIAQSSLASREVETFRIQDAPTA
ncbi:MAG: 3-deoxy-D-manno-octulosonic acid transferase [Acidobacteriota bacterium]|nr:3-deoxy-D-manno-octulosonic acid transferase [Acidobacteriota bacterium]